MIVSDVGRIEWQITLYTAGKRGSNDKGRPMISTRRSRLAVAISVGVGFIAEAHAGEAVRKARENCVSADSPYRDYACLKHAGSHRGV